MHSLSHGLENELSKISMQDDDVCAVLQTSAAEVEEARLKLQQAQAAAEAGSVPYQLRN